MVDRAAGDKLADFALRNRDRLGIKYVIYRQRINYGSGWRAMEDRGGATRTTWTTCTSPTSVAPASSTR